MSFKFNLGELVVCKNGTPPGCAKVEAFYLNGFIRLIHLQGNKKYIVREEDYEKFERKVFGVGDADNV